MLRRSNRIQGQEAMKFIIKKGAESKSRFFFAKKMENKLGRPRFGIVISKKLDKAAVKRNRKRRQIYEIIRLIMKEKDPKSLGISDSSDIVLLAKRKVMDLTFDELNAAVREILKATL